MMSEVEYFEQFTGDVSNLIGYHVRIHVHGFSCSTVLQPTIRQAIAKLLTDPPREFSALILEEIREKKHGVWGFIPIREIGRNELNNATP